MEAAEADMSKSISKSVSPPPFLKLFLKLSGVVGREKFTGDGRSGAVFRYTERGCDEHTLLCVMVTMSAEGLTDSSVVKSVEVALI